MIDFLKQCRESGYQGRGYTRGEGTLEESGHQVRVGTRGSWISRGEWTPGGREHYVRKDTSGKRTPGERGSKGVGTLGERGH